MYLSYSIPFSAYGAAWLMAILPATGTNIAGEPSIILDWSVYTQISFPFIAIDAVNVEACFKKIAINKGLFGLTINIPPISAKKQTYRYLSQACCNLFSIFRLFTQKPINFIKQLLACARLRKFMRQ